MGLACCKAECGESIGNPSLDDDVLRFLAQVQLFQRLPVDQHPALASCSSKVSFDANEVIIRQGDEGHEFFVIMNGKAAVQVDGKVVASLRSGDYFGENALLRDEPRTATIAAVTRIHALRITRADFRRLDLHEKLEFQKRGAVGGGAQKVVKVKSPTPKSDTERQLMFQALRTNAHLKTIVDLSTSAVNEMIDIAWAETVPAGTELIKQGDLDADYFYVVQEGAFEVFVNESVGKSAEQAAAAVGQIAEGGSFGELALLYFAPRAATVRAKCNSKVWVIDRNNFKNILTKKSDDVAKNYAKHLDKVESLMALQEKERVEVAKALLEMTFQKGDTITKQGEKGEMLYIVTEGEVSVLKSDKSETKLTASETNPVVVGEKVFVDSGPHSETVRVLSEKAQALTIDALSFEMLLGPLVDIQRRGAGGTSKVGGKRTSVAEPPSRQFGLIMRKDLKRLGLLGCGGFGAVELVEHGKTGEMYALKALSKGYIIKSGMQSSVMSEKTVQMLCDSPFVVKLYETYNGEQTMYFLLELALGGELYATYNRKDFFGKEPHAKFYVAGTVFAFDHMHARKIIFRDLKPENLLLNEEGRIKLTDMGLAKVVVGKTFTTCGTPDYFAPEMIQSTGHTRALDWWCLGILLFELMAGRPPFESPTPMQIYQKVIRGGINKVVFPKKVRGPAEDIVKRLCKTDPSERLPMLSGGISNIQKHPFYAGFEWQSMMNLTMDPPYKPVVKSKHDLTNFSVRKEDVPPFMQYTDKGDGWDEGFATST